MATSKTSCGTTLSAEDCPICLTELVEPSISLGCGHIVHGKCLELLVQNKPQGPSCPTCRAAIKPHRLKDAAEVQGAAKTNGYRHYVGRSATQCSGQQDPKGRSVLGRMFERLFSSSQQDPVVQQASPRVMSIGTPFDLPATDEHQEAGAANRRKLVETVLRQTTQESPLEGGEAAATTPLDAAQEARQETSQQDGEGAAVRTAAAAAAAAAGDPSSHMFLLDISGSMGSLYNWDPQSCSRLCLALAFLASHIKQKVPPGDRVCVLSFSDSVHTIANWRTRPEDFDCDEFVVTCARAISALRQGGTRLYGAFQAAYLRLKEDGQHPAPQGGQQGMGRPAPGAAPGADDAAEAVPATRQAEQQGQELPSQQLILITDGEATDPDAFEAAHKLACDPALDFNFKALLVRIQDSGSRGGEGGLRQLACYPDGQPIEYMMHTTFELPGHIDSSSQGTQTAMRTWGEATVTFKSMSSSSTVITTRRTLTVGHTV